MEQDYPGTLEAGASLQDIKSQQGQRHPVERGWLTPLLLRSFI